MKITEIREKTSEQLTELLKEQKAELFNLRFQHATGQLDNPLRIQQVKRDYARVKTVLRERELNAVNA